MDAIAILRHRAAAVTSNLCALIEQMGDAPLATAVAAGTSPLGLTLWHIPRTQDWLVNTTIRAVHERAEEFPSGLPAADTFGFGTGLTPDQARQAAAEVQLPVLTAYAQAVADDVDSWLSTLSESDLDVVPPLLERQSRRVPYCTPEALAELEGLAGLTVGALLLRPGLSHLFWHLGEVDILVQLADATGA